MKRLFVALALAFLPVALVAQVADRDVLLTPDGTLYTIESVYNDGSLDIQTTQFLRLTIQRGTQKTETIVPGSLSPGRHSRPALTYDNDSDTLFVFWIRMPNLSSELLISSYSGGKWSPVTSIDPQPFNIRSNLQVAITRRVSTLQTDSSYRDVPGLLIHAIWWEESGTGETARYALFAVSNGAISSVEVHNLDDFAPSPTHIFPNEVDADFNAEILKHPAFADNGTQNSIDVIYGDLHMSEFVRVRLKPIADGRIHIPIGAHPGGPRIVVPKSFTEPWTGAISTIVSPHDGSMLLYNTTKNAVNYIVYSGSSWSAPKSVALSEKLSADAAVAALTRMITQ
jgi:hypothetical protein